MRGRSTGKVAGVLFALTASLAVSSGCGRLRYDPDAGLADAAQMLGDAGAGDASRADGGPSDASLLDASLLDAEASDAGIADAGGADAGQSTVRPLAPWSTGVVSRARPTFRFVLDTLADSGRVEICRDRACTIVVATAVGPGSAAPASDLPATGSGSFFWRVTPLRSGMAVGPPSVVWLFHTRRAVGATAADTSLLSEMDLDGDGFADIGVGDPGLREVQIYMGSASGLGPMPMPRFTVSGLDAEYGDSVASAGDTDGDGLAELLVCSTMGRCELVRIGLSGPTTTMHSAFGSPTPLALAALGDVDGDGYSDVAMASAATAQVHVFHGGPMGLPARATTIIRSPLPGFGTSIAGGDFDGDGLGDLAVATPDSSRIDVFYGSPTGLVTPARTSIDGGRFESVSGHGDITLDGRSDLMAGIPNATRVDLYVGGPTELATSPAWMLSQPIARFGSSIAIARDVDGNGYDDALASDGDGNVWVYYATSAGPGGGIQLATPAGALTFGAAIGSSGDINGDRFADLIIGAPQSGDAYLYPGTTSGLGAELWLWTPPTAGSLLGASIARP